MGTWTKTNLWSFIILFLPGGLGGNEWIVNYPKQRICALPGSTVTIPCSYTHPAQYKVKRVVWCQDHAICQSTTPSVYDSDSPKINTRYRYFGDLYNNCTLQIERIQVKDSKVYRFRIEADRDSFTGPSGVKIDVDFMKMRITDAGPKRMVRVGDGVTLTCTALCSFHRLDISWHRNDVLLSETSPSLQLKPLTVGNTGNYSCALKTSEVETRSNSYNLFVEGTESPTEPPSSKHVTIGIVIGVLLAVLTIVGAVLFIFKRKREEVPNKGNRDSVIVPAADSIYSNIGEPVQPRTAEKEEISYATVQFKHKATPGPAHQHQEDPVIYSAVSRSQ